jgi:hypothetical protein
LDDYATQLATALDTAVKIAGKLVWGQSVSAAWWTPDCKIAHHDWLYAKDYPCPNTEEQRAAKEQFQATVRNAKRAYWRHIIDNVKDDKDLYKIMAWHKLTPNLKAPLLVVNGRSIEETLEKAEALWASVLGCFNEQDDLPEDPLENWAGSGHLPWDPSVSHKEVEMNTIGVTSTSPGTDCITVRPLKACWAHLRDPLHDLYNRCLALWHFPLPWGLAEVAMLLKVGKKDKSSVCAWRPITVLSCVSNGLERIIARCMAWTAIANSVISPNTEEPF